MKRRTIFIALLFLTMSSCSGANNHQEGPKQEYEYQVLENNKIKLTKYNGEQKSFIEVPTSYDGKEVFSIGKNCYAKRKTSRITRSHVEENEDCATYYIDSSIDTIEDGAFDSTSSFITDAQENNENWNDSALTGSAQEGEGNVYYDTTSDNTFLQDDIVYVYSPKTLGYYLARCLSQEEEIAIPGTVNGKKVTDIGMDSFLCNTYIKKVTLPNTIGVILNRAFESCRNLREVVFNCPNLGAISAEAFLNCEGLSVVKLPENVTSIRAFSFSGCGEIEEFYMPASVNTLRAKAFHNTTIKTLYFAGTQERFETCVLNDSNRYMFEGTTIVYGEEELDVLEVAIEDTINVENNTKVRIEGIISGYKNYYSNTGYRDMMVINPETNYYVQCYNHKGLPFSDLAFVGKKVIVTGFKEMHYGSVELIDSEFALYDDPKVEVSPTFMDFTAEDFDVTEYLDRFVYIDAIIQGRDGSNLFFEGADSFVGFCRNNDFHNYPDGTHVIIKGWMLMYNQTPEIDFDIRYVQAVEEVQE